MCQGTDKAVYSCTPHRGTGLLCSPYPVPGDKMADMLEMVSGGWSPFESTGWGENPPITPHM